MDVAAEEVESAPESLADFPHLLQVLPTFPQRQIQNTFPENARALWHKNCAREPDFRCVQKNGQANTAHPQHSRKPDTSAETFLAFRPRQFGGCHRQPKPRATLRCNHSCCPEKHSTLVGNRRRLLGDRAAPSNNSRPACSLPQPTCFRDI